MIHEYQRLLLVVEPALLGSGGSAPLVVATQVQRRPGRRFSFQAAVLAGRELPLVISETGISGPERGWEIRASGLWADHVCETAGEHWSYGLEAFALAVDDPVELLGRGHGQPTPLGWELEFEADGPARATGPGCRVQSGVAHGLLLGPDGPLAIEGEALRGDGVIEVMDGSAGGPDEIGAWLGDRLQRPGVAVDDDVVVEVALPTVAGVWWVARTATGARTRGY